ncbi:MAG: tetratricopeptide repeat protein [Flavobacteriales bacterium]|nr:tetratricopeptide repeat protein [Flavobacteriales bacterium]
MKIKAVHKKLFFLFVSLTLVYSCSTEKDALINKGYHNMTARYNGYFNAKLIRDEAITAFRDSYTETYHDIIPLDLYPNKKEVVSLFPDLDTAISKCEKVIVRHSMPNPDVVKNKSEEHCRWIDDNWFVIGQIHYIKHEFNDAEEKLKYVIDAYNGQTSVYEAQIWLAKTYIATGDFTNAKKYLNLAKKAMERTADKKDKDDGGSSKKKKSKYQKKKEKERKKKAKKDAPADFPKKLIPDYYAAVAELAIAEENYKMAIENIEKAIENTRNRKRKARYMFVLAQLYDEIGNGDQASNYFNKVAHSPAPYSMQFQAKINKALSATSGGTALRKELRKMLKEAKNAEYKDQIFYALAELDMKDGDVTEAKKNYSQSAFWSVKNNRQKGESYLKLGDIHFSEKDYLPAQKYYDSCVKALPEDYPDYLKIKNKAEGLSDLVYHYETVVFEDSVQRIALMPEKEREKFLEKSLKDIKAAEEKRKAEEQARLLALQKKLATQSTNTGAGKGSKWYFYNAKIKGSGFNDFRSNWGQRVLEDDWRRQNKQSLGNFGDGSDDSDSLSTDVDSLTVDMLRADIPLTEATFDSSNTRLLNSLYMLGVIYKEQLKEEKEAISYFNKVVNRNVEHPKVLPSHYQLYLIYKRGGKPKAEQHKSTILTKFPESEIAKILLDPDYLKKKEEKDKYELNEYAETYEKFRFWKYSEVNKKCDDVIANDTTNQYLNKYYLLKAFCVSKLRPGNEAAIAEPLVTLIQTDPDSEEGKQAKIYLEKLKNGENIMNNSGGNSTNSSDNGVSYVVNPNAKHYFVLVIPPNSAGGTLNRSKLKLSNFNNEYFRNMDLDVIPSILGTNEIIRINSFENKEEGMLYMSTFTSPTAKSSLGAMVDEYQSFIINKQNFKELATKLDLSAYLNFYKENYQ